MMVITKFKSPRGTAQSWVTAFSKSQFPLLFNIKRESNVKKKLYSSKQKHCTKMLLEIILFLMADKISSKRSASIKVLFIPTTTL